MRPIILVILAAFTATAYADAYKCKDQNGKVTFMASPCPDNARQLASRPDSNTTQGQYNQAQSDLDRQKAWLQNREQQKNREDQNTPQLSQQHVNNMEKLHGCLMAVTATSGLPPYTAAARRVNCYRGTKGFGGECEASVAATPGLTIHEESNLQSQCRNL